MMKKSKIYILTTGGTIAGTAARSDELTAYRAGAMGAEALLSAVPAIEDYADVRSEEIAALDSKDMTASVWLHLAARVNAILAGDAMGVVITHGTDTLEETAYFLHLTLKSDKPVVLTGAMRPATALSADGPMNLLDAVRLAVSLVAWGQGVLVTLNGEIHSARDVQKMSTTALHAFQSPGLGPLGFMEAGVPRFRRASLPRHTAKSELDAASAEALPYVPILCGHAGVDARLVAASVAGGAAGIVYAGVGNGSIHEAVLPALCEAAARGVIVVRTSRSGCGAVLPAESLYGKAGFLDGGTLPPAKARILLQLALLQTRKKEEIQRMFHTY